MIVKREINEEIPQDEINEIKNDMVDECIEEFRKKYLLPKCVDMGKGVEYELHKILKERILFKLELTLRTSMEELDTISFK